VGFRKIIGHPFCLYYTENCGTHSVEQKVHRQTESREQRKREEKQFHEGRRDSVKINSFCKIN